MTGIIFRGLEEENFSIFEFYIARANRIIPALAVLCLALLSFGWFYLNPLDYSVLGKHAGSSMGFFSNIIYWRESGYFDTASHEKWLLHTWSLSVEWQFYLIYPILLVAMRKYTSLEVIKPIILIGTIFGFIFCVVASYKWPNPSYYLLPTRAWEMMLGGIAYIYPLNCSDRKKAYLEGIGLSLIIISYAFISKEEIWPGYLALIPATGTFLIIQAQRKNSPITGNFIFQSLGKWSYSIYLWHWPLAVAVYYFSLSNQWIYYGIMLSLTLGYLSNKHIESINFRKKFTDTTDYLNCKPIHLAIFIGSASILIFSYKPNSYLNPMPESIISSIKRGSYECFDKAYQHNTDSDFCRITNGKEKIFAFGDSHSYSSLPVIEKISKDHNLELTYTGYSGCPPLIGIYPRRGDQDHKNCNVLNTRVINYIKNNKFDYVFLAARWSYYTKGEYSGNGMQYISEDNNSEINKASSIKAFKLGISRTLKKYAELGINVILMLQTPMQEKSPDKIYYSSISSGAINEGRLGSKSVSLEKHTNFQKETNKIIIDEAKKHDNVIIIDPTSEMCTNKTCPVGNKESSYYFDDDHLSIIGSFKLKELISNQILSTYKLESTSLEVDNS